MEVAPVDNFFLAVDAAVAAKEEVDNDGEGARFKFGRLLLLISLLPKPPFLLQISRHFSSFSLSLMQPPPTLLLSRNPRSLLCFCFPF